MRYPARVVLPLAMLVGLALVPRPLHAHGHLKRSRPAAGAVLREVPRTLRLEFTEALELAVSSLRLLDEGGAAVALSPVRLVPDSSRILLADITGSLAAGRYTVRWQIAGADGHPVSGTFTFIIARDAVGLAPAAERGTSMLPPAPPGPAGATGARPAETPPVSADTLRTARFDALSPLFVLIRWAQFAALLAIVGAMSFHYLVLGMLWRGEPGSPALADGDARALRLTTAAAGLLALSAVSRLGAQLHAVRVAGTGGAPVSLDALLFATGWGQAWLTQALALVMLVLAMIVARRASSRRAGWALAAVAAAVLAITPARSGHAAVPGTVLALATDAVHVLGAGGWMGGLFMVLAAGFPAVAALPADRRGATMAAMVNAFSPTALAFASLVAATGVLAGWRNLGSVGAIVSSSYGQVLLLKLATLAVAAGIGAYNWRRARPALNASGNAAPIRLAMRAEIAVGLAVLLVTAILVAVPMPADLAR